MERLEAREWMPRSETGMRNKRGFTLIELLVVIIIIAIVASTALLAFGDFGAKRQTLIAAQQFEAYLELVQQQAILENGVFGITITRENYTTFRLVNSKWQMVEKNRTLKQQFFPKNTEVIIVNSSNPTHSLPDLVISPLGNMTRLTINFCSSKDNVVATMTIQNNGSIRLSYAP